MIEFKSYLHLTLKRGEETQYGLFGELFLTEERICYTLERPWRDNKKNISCIPAGEYVLTRWQSHRHGDCFIILGNHGREDILVHVGNKLFESLGCVLVGLEHNEKQLISSKLALNKLKGMMPRNVWCRLTII